MSTGISEHHCDDMLTSMPTALSSPHLGHVVSEVCPTPPVSRRGGMLPGSSKLRYNLQHSVVVRWNVTRLVVCTRLRLADSLAVV